jgi:hypothetical protein
MHYDYDAKQCAAEVMNVYRDTMHSGVSYRSNDPQRIFEVRVNRVKQQNG